MRTAHAVKLIREPAPADHWAGLRLSGWVSLPMNVRSSIALESFCS